MSTLSPLETKLKFFQESDETSCKFKVMLYWPKKEIFDEAGDGLFRNFTPFFKFKVGFENDENDGLKNKYAVKNIQIQY